MQKKFFKRSVQEIALLMLFVVMFIVSMEFFWKMFNDDNSNGIPYEIIIITVILVVMTVVTLIIPDDFKYWIRVEGDYIIFEKNETDHRPILRKYVVIKENYKIMVLEDERGTIISIPYDAEVREFLKQHRIE